MKMTFENLKKITDAIAKENYALAARLCREFANSDYGIHWKRDLAKLATVCENARNGSATKKFVIFHKRGNTKLKNRFLVFSSLPGVFCPGAGECLKKCFSFKAWRYPAPFCRQAQNTILLQTKEGRRLIAKEFANIKLPKGQSEMAFRLYVDGDHSNFDQFSFWCELIKTRNEFKAYGYTKSLKLAIEYHEKGHSFPENYILNLSEGHKYNQAVADKFASLPITRGEFIGVGKKGALKYGTKEYKAAARKAFRETGDKRSPFICPGLCDGCTPKGHACGSRKFENIPIVILNH